MFTKKVNKDKELAATLRVFSTSKYIYIYMDIHAAGVCRIKPRPSHTCPLYKGHLM